MTATQQMKPRGVVRNYLYTDQVCRGTCIPLHLSGALVCRFCSAPSNAIRSFSLRPLRRTLTACHTIYILHRWTVPRSSLKYATTTISRSMGIPGCNYPLDTLEGQASASTCMTMQAMIAETYLSGRETWEQNRALCIAVGGDLSENVSDLF